MKAIRVHEFGAPGVMRLEAVPEPRPGAGQVVVRIYAAGVNPVDAYVRAGLYARTPALPYTPGTDAAGVVEAMGAGVARLKPGDRIYTAGTVSGAYAELALCEAAQVHPLPDHVSFPQGACLHVPYATAYRALYHCAGAAPGEVVFVHGASGGVGIAALQLARAAGMVLIGSAGTERGRTLVGEQGAHTVLDHTDAAYLEDVLLATQGRGCDVILEMAAHVNLGRDLGLLARHGRVVVIGSRGPVQVDPREAMVREARIIGTLLFNATEVERTATHAALHAGLHLGTVRPVVGLELTLAEAPRAHQRLMERGAYGKIILIP